MEIINNTEKLQQLQIYFDPLTIYFRRLGYTSNYEIKAFEPLPVPEQYLEIKYINLIAKRKIDVSFFYRNPITNQTGLINAMIVRTPYNDFTDAMSISNLLRKRNPHFDEGEFETAHYSGAYESQLSKLVNNLIELFDKYAADIINGKKWDGSLISRVVIDIHPPQGRPCEAGALAARLTLLNRRVLCMFNFCGKSHPAGIKN